MFDEIIPKEEEIFPSRENEFWCVRVCSRRTQSDRKDLLLLFVRALYTARIDESRSLDVSVMRVQVNKDCALCGVFCERDKNKRHRRVAFSPLSRRKKIV